MPFRVVPRVIHGQATVDDLNGKEIVAHLMLDPESAMQIDRYKFKINKKIFTYLLYKKLREMSCAQGWRWQKAKKIKKDKYDKLIDEYLPLFSQAASISMREITEYKYDRILRKMMDDEETRRGIVEQMIEYKDIQDSKKIDRFRKKYDIKQKQQSLW